MDSNLTFSLMRLLDCFFDPFTPKEVRLSTQNFLSILPFFIASYNDYRIFYFTGGDLFCQVVLLCAQCFIEQSQFTRIDSSQKFLSTSMPLMG